MRIHPVVSEDLEDPVAVENRSTYVRLRQFFSRNKNILVPTAVESAVAFTCAAITTPFMEQDTPFYQHPFALTSLMLMLNHASRVASRSERNTPPIFAERQECNNIFGRCFASFASPPFMRARSALFTIIDMLFRSTLWHEIAHAVMFLLLYQNAHPAITIQSWGSGFTSSHFMPDGKSLLSEFGAYLGEKTSNAVVSGSGSAFQMLWGCGSLTAAQIIPDHYRELKSHIRWVATMSFLSPIQYAFSATWSCNPPNPPGHDFCVLQDNGIDPIVAALMMIAIASLTQLALSGCTKLKRHCATPRIGVADEIPEEPISNMTEAKEPKSPYQPMRP